MPVSFIAVAEKQQPYFDINGKIILKETNNINKGHLQMYAPQFITYLRKYTTNNEIEIDIILEQNNDLEMPKTSKVTFERNYRNKPKCVGTNKKIRFEFRLKYDSYFNL